MKGIFSLFFMVIIVTGLLFSCDMSENKCSNSKESNSNDGKKTVLKNIPYVSGATDKQKMDIYFPTNIEAGKSYPALFWLPGGSWLRCNKDGDISLLETKDITEQGYILVKMNYRVMLDESNNSFIKGITVKSMLSDIDSAINYLKNNAKQYSFNGKFGLIGASAGGHLSMLYGYKQKPKGLMFIINEYGPSDFTDPSYLYTNIDDDNSYCDCFKCWFWEAQCLDSSITTRSRFINKLIYLLTGSELNNSMYDDIKDAKKVTADTLNKYLVNGHLSRSILPKEWLEASPLEYITSDCVPTMLAFGEKDSLVKKESQYDFLKAKLDSCGVTNYGIVFPASGHGLDVVGTESPNETYKKVFVEKVRDFLNGKYTNGEYKE